MAFSFTPFSLTPGKLKSQGSGNLFVASVPWPRVQGGTSRVDPRNTSFAVLLNLANGFRASTRSVCRSEESSSRALIVGVLEMFREWSRCGTPV